MSWFKAAGSYASGAIKAAATAVAPPSQRSAREQLKDHVTYLRSFAEATQQDKGADWDKLALTYRVPEELDSMLQLLEAENPNANAMREDPCKGPCTMFFLEECVMDMLYTLMGLEYSVNLQKWVIKAVIRVLRLRYELLDTGSIARLVLQMAERLEYSAKRLHFAIVHCEFLFTLCDKVQRNPWSLLPVMVSEGVNQGGLGATSGQELLLLNWTVQHIQDTAGGEYAQRGVLLLLRISDERVTTAACHHSSLIERTVRMVDSGFQSGMREMDQTDALDEVGSVRRRPDTSQFYSAMRFVDHILRVAHPSISRQLLDKLDSQFMRQTLSHRLLKGSEVCLPACVFVWGQGGFVLKVANAGAARGGYGDFKGPVRARFSVAVARDLLAQAAASVYIRVCVRIMPYNLTFVRLYGCLFVCLVLCFCSHV